MTSGIRDVGGPQPWQAQIAAIAKAPLLFTPRTESFYSNTNYDLLGELIEQWTGESYGYFLENQILQPLGMSQTQELGQSATVANQAVGYNAPRNRRWPRALVENGPDMYAAAGMVSTAQDMATYMTALLSERILNPATYALMWTSTPTPEYGVKPTVNAERGLGWDTVIQRSNGTEKITKGGEVPGFTSEIVLDPTTGSGVFVSFNANFAGSRNPNGVTALQVARSVYDATKEDS
jgi:CubicO group peptidase (beta-lactamase class C family)